jgi:hypothetical protein
LWRHQAKLSLFWSLNPPTIFNCVCVCVCVCVEVTFRYSV